MNSGNMAPFVWGVLSSLVAACIVVAVLFAFGPTGSGVIGQALSNGIAAIVSKIPTS